METTLSTDLFYGMILSGAKKVIQNETTLNQLNVFPVADRDTGTNLASMMRYIVDHLSPAKDTPELLHQLSQHSLVGCCGNSGLIFSQFFYGLTQYNPKEKVLLKLNDFVDMMASGYKSAYESVSNPKAGTILTVMEEWVDGYRNHLKRVSTNLVDSFKFSLEQAHKALKGTMNQLEILRSNHVVDAGAQGFVNFLEGMLAFLSVGKDEQKKMLTKQNADEAINLKINHEFESVTELPTMQYCFETIVRLTSTTKDTNSVPINPLLKHQDYLNSLGDSLVVGHGPQMLKLHMHTNQPRAVTKLLTTLGDVFYQKIDDMMLQYKVSNQPPAAKIALVVDSMADLPEEFLQQHNICRIPLQVKVNGHSFLDKISISYQETLAYLEDSANQVGTSAPSTAIVARTLHYLQQHHESIIVLSVSSGLSSTYDVIAHQARRCQDSKISVIDSGSNSAALGMLALYAQQLISSGMPHNEIVTKLEEAKKQTNLLVMLNSLDGVIRSGRLSKSVGKFARWLGLKALIHINDLGKPQIFGAALTKNGAWKKMAKKINQLRAQQPIKALAIAHSDTEEHAQSFSNFLNQQCNINPLYITEVSSVSGIHADKDSFSVGYFSHELSL